MKKQFLFIALGMTALLSAQEAATVGKHLQNEAKLSDINKLRIQIEVDGGSQRRPDLDQYRNSPQQYQWEMQAPGTSEVFLRIPERGYFTVSVGAQQISGDTGKFRFFDLPSRPQPITIYLNGYLVYRSTLYPQPNSRTVLDYFIRYGLYELDTYPIQEQWYGVQNWNDLWNNPYRATPHLPENPSMRVMPDDVFTTFYNAYRRLSFDSERNEYLQAQPKVAFTCAQIKLLITEFNFDKDKYQWATALYPRCVDKGNYFTLYEVFTFERYRKDLMRFISKQ